MLSSVPLPGILRRMVRYQAYIEKDWERLGLAQVVVTRRRADGSADYALFLVDTFCLGVKDALAETNVTEAWLREELIERLPEDFRDPIHPACARKLIEGAVAYAESLGFSPHRDYRKARKILSGVDASACPQEFTYGRDGRPCYIRANGDSDERIRRVCAILGARFGPDGFDYEDPREEEIDPIQARGELMIMLEAAPAEVPRFYFVSGLMTALLLCPDPSIAVPSTLFAVLGSDTAGDWPAPEDLPYFTDLLLTYWNAVNDDVLDAIAPGAGPDDHIINIWEEDFSGSKDRDVQFLAAHVEWAAGFLEALARWPGVCTAALARPDLATHWEVVRWWGDFSEESHEKILAHADSPQPRGLDISIHALARALRQP